MAIKASISKANKHNFVPKITGDAVDFFNNIVCLMNKFSYCNDSVKVVLTNLLFKEILIWQRRIQQMGSGKQTLSENWNQWVWDDCYWIFSWKYYQSENPNFIFITTFINTVNWKTWKVILVSQRLLLAFISVVITKTNSAMKYKVSNLFMRHSLFLLLSTMLKFTLVGFSKQQLTKVLFLWFC